MNDLLTLIVVALALTVAILAVFRSRHHADRAVAASRKAGEAAARSEAAALRALAAADRSESAAAAAAAARAAVIVRANQHLGQ